MATLESRTVNGKRIKLERKSSSEPGQIYEYHVTEDGTQIIEPFTNKRDAKKYYKDTVKDFQRRQGEQRSEGRGSFLPGFGSGASNGGGDVIPEVDDAWDDDMDDGLDDFGLGDDFWD